MTSIDDSKWSSLSLLSSTGLPCNCNCLLVIVTSSIIALLIACGIANYRLLDCTLPQMTVASFFTHRTQEQTGASCWVSWQSLSILSCKGDVLSHFNVSICLSPSSGLSCRNFSYLANSVILYAPVVYQWMSMLVSLCNSLKVGNKAKVRVNKSSLFHLKKLEASKWKGVIFIYIFPWYKGYC